MRKLLPTVMTLALLTFAGAAAQVLSTGSAPAEHDSVATTSSEPSRTAAAARGYRYDAIETDPPTPTPTESPTPEPTVEPTAEPTPPPPPPPTRAPTRPPTPRPTPAPTLPPNPNGMGISGRVTDQTGAGFGGVCVTVGPPIRCATTTADDGRYFVSLEGAPAGIAWDIHFVVGGVDRLVKPGIVVSGPVVLNVTIAR